MNNAEYWARRFKIMEDALKDQSYDYALNLERQFDIAIRDIDTQMRAWYQRFAKNNEITLAEAKRLLTTDELKEFRWTIQEYIKKGKEMNIGGAWIKELENASARVHISRLDALKYQLQQQAEVLAHAKIKATTDASSLAYTESYYHTAFEVQKGFGVGWTMQALNEDAIKKVLSRPWTVDNKTFTARCWTDKVKLVETVNQQITQMMARGTAPDKAIETIAKQFNTSKSNAGRVVMTESAYFSSAAQKDCFNELGVEQYIIVGTLDIHTCDICGDMDGRVYKMSDYVVGSTAPPFHPWCRCCTAPYFEDMEGIGERYARDVETGQRYMLPKETTYKQWKQMQNATHGTIFVDNAAGSDIIKSILVDDINVAITGKEIDTKAVDTISKYFAWNGNENGYYVNNIVVRSIPKEKNGGTPLMQILPVRRGRMYETELILNEDLFKGSTIDELNDMVYRTSSNIARNFEEAVIHETGHAKVVYANRHNDIEKLYRELKNAGVKDISDIAFADGAEAIAEIEILMFRGEKVPELAMELYKKVMKGEFISE